MCVCTSVLYVLCMMCVRVCVCVSYINSDVLLEVDIVCDPIDGIGELSVIAYDGE